MIGAITSPCTSVCRMDATSGLCEGCLRTIHEIAAWATLEEREKRVVWKLLHQRRALRAQAVAVVPDGVNR